MCGLLPCALLFILWTTIVVGVLAGSLVPVATLVLPGEVRLALPAEINHNAGVYFHWARWAVGGASHLAHALQGVRRRSW